MMARRRRHNVFVSYYHDQDQRDKESFVRMMGDNIIDRSVNIGDVPGPNPPTEETLQRIREEFVAQVSVTVVLIECCTWQRKYVDWEIGASLRDTQANPRCGLLGILLSGHPDFGRTSYRGQLIPPRLADNCEGDDPFASIHDWSDDPDVVRGWIHDAFVRRRRQPDPNNSRLPFGRNWNGNCMEGWQR